MKIGSIRRGFLLAITSSLAITSLPAQEIVVKNIAPLTLDISARSSGRVDSNGHDCAIIRVNIPTIKQMAFENNVGDVEYNAGEYVVYTSEGTTQIPVSAEGYKPSVIDFDKFGVPIKGKCVYRATLAVTEAKNHSHDNTGSINITTEPESNVILIDGEPVGSSPMIVEGIEEGEHVISFPNVSGYSLEDQKVLVKRGEVVDKHFILNEKDYDESVYNEVSVAGITMDGGGLMPQKYKIIEENGKKGIADYWNHTLVPCEFDYVDNESTGALFMVGEGKPARWGLYKPGTGLILPCEYSNLIWYGDDEIVIVWKGMEKAGVVSRNDGHEILPCIYENINHFWGGGVYSVCYKDQYNKKKLYGLVDKQGRTIIEPKYDFITSFSYGYALARDINDNVFLIDSLGNEQIIPSGYSPEVWSTFDGSSCYTEGLLCLKKKGSKCGVLDISGAELVAFEHDERNECKNGWIIFKDVLQGGKKEYFIYDKNGHTYKSDDEPMIFGRFLAMSKDDKYGVIDQNGKIILPFEYDHIDKSYSYRGIIEEKYLYAQKGDIHEAYDKMCNLLLSLECPEGLSFGGYRDGIAVVRDEESNYYGYINDKGEVLAGCLYDSSSLENMYLNDFTETDLISDGYAMLCIGDRCGYVNKEGKIVVPLIYSIIVPFYDGTIYGLRQDHTWEEIVLRGK